MSKRPYQREYDDASASVRNRKPRRPPPSRNRSGASSVYHRTLVEAERSPSLRDREGMGSMSTSTLTIDQNPDAGAPRGLMIDPVPEADLCLCPDHQAMEAMKATVPVSLSTCRAEAIHLIGSPTVTCSHQVTAMAIAIMPTHLHHTVLHIQCDNLPKVTTQTRSFLIMRTTSFTFIRRHPLAA